MRSSTEHGEHWAEHPQKRPRESQRAREPVIFCSRLGRRRENKHFGSKKIYKRKKRVYFLICVRIQRNIKRWWLIYLKCIGDLKIWSVIQSDQNTKLLNLKPVDSDKIVCGKVKQRCPVVSIFFAIMWYWDSFPFINLLMKQTNKQTRLTKTFFKLNL